MPKVLWEQDFWSREDSGLSPYSTLRLRDDQASAASALGPEALALPLRCRGAADKQRAGKARGRLGVWVLPLQHGLRKLEGGTKNRGSQVLRVLRRKDAPGDGALDVLAQFRQTRLEFGGVRAQVQHVAALHRLELFAVFSGIGKEAAEGTPDEGLRRFGGEACFAQNGPHDFGGRLTEGFKHFLLRLEVIVEGAGRERRGADHIAHRGRAIAPLGEDAAGGIENKETIARFGLCALA